MADHPPKAFVIGWPIAHSLSPIVHAFWLEQHNLSGSYEKIPVQPEELNQFLSRLIQGRFVGGNVTIPHKQAVFQLVENCDTNARQLEAVNTLWLENGKLMAANTDGYGFTANMNEGAPDWLDGERATILGAGGAARAIAAAIGQVGYRSISIVNRTHSRARQLCNALGRGFHPVAWQDLGDELRQTDLLVNTTSAGMKGQPDLEVDLSNLKSDSVVCDIVYNPLETSLLRNARLRGLTTVDGIGMLLHQATPGFEKWFGLRPKVTPELRAHVLDHLNRSPK